MSKSRLLSGAVIDAMRASGWLRSSGYALKAGFDGTYVIEDVKETKTRTSKEFNNFMVHCGHGTGKVVIPGSILANARIISSSTISADDKAKASKDAPIFFADGIEDVIDSSVLFNEDQDFGSDGYKFPEGFKIVGAVVTKIDGTDTPSMPLRKYKNYNKVLSHHRKIEEAKEAFITRDLFADYLEEGNIPGVKDTDTTLELLSTVDPADMKHWNFTLLITDLKE